MFKQMLWLLSKQANFEIYGSPLVAEHVDNTGGLITKIQWVVVVKNLFVRCEMQTNVFQGKKNKKMHMNLPTKWQLANTIK